MHTVFIFTNAWFALNCFVHMFGVIFLCPLLSSMSISFTVDSMIQGNHVYKDTWDSHLGEELACRHERNNIYDLFAVAVLKLDAIVGHVPRAI